MTRKANRWTVVCVFLGLCTMAAATPGPAPVVINHQGVVKVGDRPFTGDGNFRFAIVDPGTSTNLWTNDGTQVGTVDMPTAALVLVCTDGVWSAALGDASMTAIPASVFENGDLLLRVWFDDGVNPTELLSPDLALASAPYAVRALTAETAVTAGVQDDGVGSAQIINGSVAEEDLADGAALAEILDNDGSGSELDADRIDGLDSTNFWNIMGNTALNEYVNFLGTTDNKPLIMKVNGQHAMHLEPTGGTPNVVGGSSANAVAGVQGATIGGGGFPTLPNTVDGAFGTVSGGQNNSAGATATVGGGASNVANGSFGTVSGGEKNAAEGAHATVGGGTLNGANSPAATVAGGSDNGALASYAAIGGGASNRATGQYVAVGGGLSNEATSLYGTIGGGAQNVADGEGVTVGGGGQNEAVGQYATISGGGPSTTLGGNRVTDQYGTVGGGSGNVAGDDVDPLVSAGYATVAGGQDNAAAGWSSFVGGGSGNVASGQTSVLGGGTNNEASAENATVGGGTNNVAEGARGTVAGGAGNKAGAADAAVGGGQGNWATGAASTVAGGGANQAEGDYGIVGGGTGNHASGAKAIVGGGMTNEASAEYASVVGGLSNVADELGASIGGGQENAANGEYVAVGGGYGNVAAGESATISGGSANETDGSYATVGGGYTNQALGVRNTIGGGGENFTNSQFATVAGGNNNSAMGNGAAVGGGASNEAGAAYAAVAGGQNNIASGSYAAISGGTVNRATVNCAAVGGGNGNTASGSCSSVGGGASNQATGDMSTVSGGQANVASGQYATVPGGIQNTASGQYSYAAGRMATAAHNGAFVWADSAGTALTSDRANQFKVRAGGGMLVQATSSGLSPAALKVTASGGTAVGLFVEQTSSDCTLVVTNKGAGDLIKAYGTSDASEVRFRVNQAGNVFADGTFTGGGADFAEFMPRADAAEPLEPGDLVGVIDGGVTRKTEGASRVHVVTTKPVVVGGQPEEGKEAGYVPVAFMGRVPVKVLGPVAAGDFIVPSGQQDGCGVARRAAAIRLDQVDSVAGQAIESSTEPGVKTVLVLVGAAQESLWQAALQQRDSEIAGLRSELDAVKALVEQLVQK